MPKTSCSYTGSHLAIVTVTITVIDHITLLYQPHITYLHYDKNVPTLTLTPM